MTQNNVKIQAGLPAIGTQVDGRYELLGLLGRGGFGAVYLARQISMDRDVALKILLTQALNMEEMVLRFKREVMAIRNLSHPNTIQIYDFSKSDAGFLYYAMEAVKGPTLKKIIKDDGPLPPVRVKHICRQILKSLSEAHASRIVHRDLKPANIMLAEMHGEVDFVKVLDFGIAKLLDAEDGEEELTNAGVLIGTISYMSPEQISSKNIGATTDIYALGLIGIEMLSGQSVFAKSGKWEILNKQISSDPIEIPDFVKNDPVGRLFMKAVSKDPAERFQSAVEMIQAFDSISVCSGTPLVQKGWGKPAKSGIKSSSISQSGPISVSSRSMQNPISQPVPISVDALQEMTVMEPNSQIISNSQVVQYSDANSGYTNIENPKRSKTPMIIGIVLVALLAVAGGLFFLSGKKMPGEMEGTPLTKEVVEKVVIEEPVEVIEKPVEVVEKEVEKTVVKKIQLTGPENAAVFSEDNVQLGDLPIEVSVSEPTTFRIKAKGFVQKNLVVSPSSNAEIVVRLVAEKPQPPKYVKKRRADQKKVDRKTKEGTGWAPIKKKDKVTAWD